MWKKLHRPRDHSAGRHNIPTTLTEADKQHGFFETTISSGSPNGSNGNHPPPISIEQYNTSKELPPDPRVASSIYSRPDSVANPQLRNELRIQPPRDVNTYHSVYRDSEYTDVSPPVSPLYGHFDHSRESPDVSPIDNYPDPASQFPRQGNQFTSSLPRPRNAVNTTELKKGRPDDVGSDPASKEPTPVKDSHRLTRWDDFSGEPTQSDKGQYAQSTPSNSPLQELEKSKSAQKSQFSFTGKDKGSGQSRRNILRGRRHRDTDDPAEPQPSRMPWKGASGRSAIVAPIKSKKNLGLKQSNHPPRTDSQQQKDQGPLPGPMDPGNPVGSSSRTNDTKQLPHEPSIKPPVPAKNDSFQPSSRKQSIALPETAGDDSGVKKLNQEYTVLQGDESNLNTFQQEPHAPDNGHGREQMPYLETGFQHLDLNEQPSSRFSMTTYATTEAGSPPGSPGARDADSDAPPVPNIPINMQAASGQTAKTTTRKPTPSQTAGSAQKTLPQSPPEMTAGNRIDTLQAKLDDLARRRGNIGTIIHELTQVIQPSSIAYDMATRGEVSKTVDSLNNELADIKRDEHELGLKLLRAHKKKDESENYTEPSGLWIKRVGG